LDIPAWILEIGKRVKIINGKAADKMSFFMSFPVKHPVRLLRDPPFKNPALHRVSAVLLFHANTRQWGMSSVDYRK
jgi:hypothetical protein